MPTATPFIIPEKPPMVATPGVLLVQLPPPGADVSVVEKPTQTAFAPPVVGVVFTDTVFMALQPVGIR